MRSSWHFNTSGFNGRFPRTPKMKTKIWKNVHQITSIFYILLSFGVILRCLWGLEAYIYIMLTNEYWFRATGGYICGCGRPSNLVDPNSQSWPEVMFGQVWVGHYLDTIGPNSHENWPKVKLGQIEFSSNIAPNNFSCLYEVISGEYLPQFTCKVDPKFQSSPVRVGSNIARNCSSGF